VIANGNWNGSELVEKADRDMVFVNFNYRVGLWGFLAGEQVRQHGDLNAGLLDQKFVLEWVQKHISKVSTFSNKQASPGTVRSPSPFIR
jgi:carboxylesterase type B